MNALSVAVRAEVHRDGAYHVQEYKEGGKPVAKVKKLGKSDKNGTIITFEADPLIFPEIVYDFKTIVDHLRQQAYLVRGMRITIVDAREYEGEIKDTEVFYLRELKDSLLAVAPSQTFYFDGGLKSLVAFENRHQKPMHKRIFHVEKEHKAPEGSGQQDVQVEVALQYVDDISGRIVAYANNIYNPEGGMHITGFKTALTRTINNFVKKSKMKGVDGNFTGDDVLEGITVVVSVKLQEIQFEGQTKAKLGSVEARGAVDTVFSEAFAEFLEENPAEAKAIIQKSMLAMRARKAAKAAKDSVLRKGALEGMTLPGKLSDCQAGTKPEDAEIFIVEGDSAGGTAKAGRDRKTQAILPLRGKILNVERARLDRMLGSEQIKNVVVALGTAIGDTFDIGKLRYHKVIIATDADVDGEHIQTLMLTLFYRYFRELIDGGFLYIAQPPLYKIKKGKSIQYFYTETEKVDYETENGVDESGSGSIQRYKGLGEMNAEELWETTMDPEARILKQVRVEDARNADRVFDMLMGKDVPARKAFIQSHAKEATLDI
jgi:DNA gyrase subunit B